jgi:hypothetical protein
MATWLWDVTIAGGTDTEIRKLKRELEGTKVRPGSFRIHNDRIAYDPVAPQLVPGNMEEAVKMFKVYILGGAGMPEHFFGEPGETNRSMGAELAETAYKMFEERQSYFKYMLTDIFNFVIDQAVIHQMIPKRVKRDFEIIMPRVSKREIQRSGGAVLRVTQALDVGARNGWIDIDKAQQIFMASIDQIGLGISALGDMKKPKKPEQLTFEKPEDKDEDQDKEDLDKDKEQDGKTKEEDNK